MTQTAAILNALQRQWLTPLDALQQHGCMRLSARVFELREQGESIADKWIDLPNGKRIKAYRCVTMYRSAHQTECLTESA